MYKKILIQVLLFLIIIIIIFITFYFIDYSKKEITDIKEDISKDKVALDENNNSSNLIEDLKYFSTDDSGNKYEINAKKGEINIDKPELIYMTNVTAIITMKDSIPIKIRSDYATYDNINYDTYFKENVLINHQTHKITGNNLELLFKTRKANMYENVTYTNVNTTLNADRIEIDLITKNSKIFMDNSYEKIQISMKE